MGNSLSIHKYILIVCVILTKEDVDVSFSKYID